MVPFSSDAGASAAAGSAGSGDFQQALESTPAFTLAELKPDEALVVLSSEGAGSSEVTGVIVLAGVEPALGAQPEGKGNEVVLGPWKMGMGSGEGGPSGGCARTLTKNNVVFI